MAKFLKLDIQFFGASASAENTSLKSTAGNKGTLKVSFTEADLTDTNITNNTSTITAKASFTQVTGNWSGFSSPYLRLYWYDNNEHKNGTELVNMNVTSMAKGATEDIDLTFHVKHLADGSLKGYAQAKWEYEASGTLPCRTGYATTAETDLTTVPRATVPTLSASELTLGQPITIYTDGASDSFTHDLYYKVGNSATTRFATGVVDSYTWTNNLFLANWITDNDNATVTIYCKTFNGTTLIGEKNVTFKGNVPESIIPEIETFTVSEYVTDVADKVGVYLKGKSRLSISATASGNYASKITGYKITANGETFSTNSATTNVLKNSGTQTVNLTVTDSRGRTATKSISINVIDYYSPNAKTISVVRCNKDGTLNDEGTYAKATISYAIAPIDNKNSKSVAIQYLNGETWTTLKTINDAYSKTNATYLIEDKIFSIDSSYKFRLLVEDYFTSDEVTDTLSAGATLFNFHASGKALGIGKVVEKENYLDIAYMTRLGGGIEAIELEAGTNLDNITTPGFYKGYGQNPCPNDAFTLEVFVDSDGSIKQVFRKHKKNSTDRNLYGIATFERDYTDGWTKWTCTSGYISAYNNTGDYGWYKLLTLGSTSGWGQVSGTITISTSNSGMGNTEAELAFAYYNNGTPSLTIIRSNRPTSHFKAIKFADNSVGIFVATSTVYAQLNVNINSLEFNYSVDINPEYYASSLPSGTQYNATVKENVALDVLTSEEQLVGYWVDGKPLYRKTIITSESILANTPLAIPHGITNYDTIWIDMANSFFFASDLKMSLPIEQTFYTATSDSDKLHTYVSGNNIYFVSSGGWGARWGKVIVLKYTRA